MTHIIKKYLKALFFCLFLLIVPFINFSTQAATTRYPIILQHGFFSDGTYLGKPYWDNIPQYLNDHGHKAFTTKTIPFGEVERIAKQMAKQIDEVLEKTGNQKVNIVAHSFGGIVSRYLITTLGYAPKIASLTTISTPHRGDILANILCKGTLEGNFEIILRALSNIFYGEEGKDIPTGAFRPITYEAMETFNKNTPNSPNVYYQSWAGISSILGFDTGSFLPFFLYIPFGILLSNEGRNDGMVSVWSAKWGRYRGTISANHLDQTGLDFGQSTGSFDHQGFIYDIAEELGDMGF